jgi:hypothetical protein
MAVAAGLAAGGFYFSTRAAGLENDLATHAYPLDQRNQRGRAFWNDTAASSWLFAGAGAAAATSGCLAALLQDVRGKGPSGKPLRGSPSGLGWTVVAAGAIAGVAVLGLSGFAELQRQQILSRQEVFTAPALAEYRGPETAALVAVSGTAVLMLGSLVAAALLPEAFVAAE